MEPTAWRAGCPGAKGRASMSSAPKGRCHREEAGARPLLIHCLDRASSAASLRLLHPPLLPPPLAGVTLSSPQQVRLGAGGGLVTRAGHRCHGPPVGPAPAWEQGCGGRRAVRATRLWSGSLCRSLAGRARDQGVRSSKQVPECFKVRAKDHRDQDGGGRAGLGTYVPGRELLGGEGGDQGGVSQVAARSFETGRG